MWKSYVVLPLLLVSTSAFGWSLLYPTRSWEITPVTVEINQKRCEKSVVAPDPDCGKTATVDALNSASGWNGPVPGLVDATLTSNKFVLGDGVPTITFNDPLGICTGSCLAATLTGYYGAQGPDVFIEDADIFVTKRRAIKFTSEAEIAPGDPCWNQYYLEGVMVHEVGHALGLGHSNVNGSTMSAYATACDDGLDAISSDDETAIDVLY